MVAQRRSLLRYFSTLEEKFRIFKCEDIMFSRKSSLGISLLFYIIKLYFFTIANGSVISCCKLYDEGLTAINNTQGQMKTD